MWGDVKRTRIVVGGTRQFAEPAPTAAVVMPVGNRSTAKLPQSLQSGDVDTVSVGRSSAKVLLTIHDMRGRAVRTLEVGYQPAGVYRSRERAAYWDGRNRQGETVANGVYFCTLSADNFTATRKMLVDK